jgi:hypothetical protein
VGPEAIATNAARRCPPSQVWDQWELARLAHVTQSPMPQIMSLSHVAPDIQESLLFLPRVESSRAPIREKLLRLIAAEIDLNK